MDNKRLNLRIVAAIAACLAVTMFASCKKETPDLNGTVTISPTANVFTGAELTATYSGSEKITWQWNKGGTAIGGATNDKFTPTEAGNYTVTANAAGYNSKTSAAVEVKAIQNLNGTVTISPLANAFIGDELTATYSGSETVSWQWNKSGTAINGATNNKYTPTEAGSYTATANATGYNSKTSAAVEVKPVTLLEELQNGVVRIVYEYDNQNRLTKLSYYHDGQLNEVETYNYNAAGDLTELKVEYPTSPESDEKVTFSKIGNKITFTKFNGLYEFEVNAQGLPVKYLYEMVYDSDNWNKQTTTFTWQNGNLTKEIYVDEQKWKEDGEVWGSSNQATYTYTHDDKKSPFYHCKTPKWFLWWYVDRGFCNENNIRTTTQKWEGEEPVTHEFAYEYNADGFPVTQKAGDWLNVTYKYKKK